MARGNGHEERRSGTRQRQEARGERPWQCGEVVPLELEGGLGTVDVKVADLWVAARKRRVHGTRNRKRSWRREAQQKLRGTRSVAAWRERHLQRVFHRPL